MQLRWRTSSAFIQPSSPVGFVGKQKTTVCCPTWLPKVSKSADALMNHHRNLDRVNERPREHKSVIFCRSSLSCRLYVAYEFSPLYPAFATEIGEKSAPVMGLNDIFGSF